MDLCTQSATSVDLTIENVIGPTADYIASLFDDEENICITCVRH